MNVLHLRYAVEVERNGSISGAAEKLYMGQPNLSKAIRELEHAIGITLFTRTTKGVTTTPQGKEFLHYAKNVLSQLDEMENLYIKGKQSIRRFSISVPRASYIAHAFTRFIQQAGTEGELEFHFKETNTQRAISNMLRNDFRLGIIRYPLEHENYYQNMLQERGMKSKEIWTFSPCLLFSKNSPLAQKSLLTTEALEPFLEIEHGDNHLPQIGQQSKELKEGDRRKIFVYERGSQFDLLNALPDTYMWVSPLPEALLKQHGLMQQAVHEDRQYFRDLFLYPSEYHLTELDNLFLEELLAVKKELTVDL